MVFLLSQAGCGTLASIGYDDPYPNIVYGGVRRELAPLSPHTCLDIPLSAVADTIVLPYTIPRSIFNSKHPEKASRDKHGYLQRSHTGHDTGTHLVNKLTASPYHCRPRTIVLSPELCGVGCVTVEEAQIHSPDGSDLRAIHLTTPIPSDENGVHIKSAKIRFEGNREVVLEFVDGGAIVLREPHHAANSAGSSIRAVSILDGTIAVSEVRHAAELIPRTLAKQIADKYSPVHDEATTLAWEILSADKMIVRGVAQGWLVSGVIPLTPDDRRLLDTSLRAGQ